MSWPDEVARLARRALELHTIAHANSPDCFEKIRDRQRFLRVAAVLHQPAPESFCSIYRDDSGNLRPIATGLEHRARLAHARLVFCDYSEDNLEDDPICVIKALEARVRHHCEHNGALDAVAMWTLEVGLVQIHDLLGWYANGLPAGDQA